MACQTVGHFVPEDGRQFILVSGKPKQARHYKDVIIGQYKGIGHVRPHNSKGSIFGIVIQSIFLGELLGRLTDYSTHSLDRDRGRVIFGQNFAAKLVFETLVFLVSQLMFPLRWRSNPTTTLRQGDSIQEPIIEKGATRDGDSSTKDPNVGWKGIIFIVVVVVVVVSGRETNSGSSSTAAEATLLLDWEFGRKCTLFMFHRRDGGMAQRSGGEHPFSSYGGL
jgi:hypothetical protein